MNDTRQIRLVSSRPLSRLRLVPLTRPTLNMMVALERDPLIAELASGEEFAERSLTYGLSVLAIRDGYFIACGGLVPHWSGRAEAWALISANAAQRDLVAAARLCRDWLDKRQRNPVFRRVECYVQRDAPWRRSFMRALGFEPEGCLRGWGPDGSDFNVYARIREFEGSGA